MNDVYNEIIGCLLKLRPATQVIEKVIERLALQFHYAVNGRVILKDGRPGKALHKQIDLAAGEAIGKLLEERRKKQLVSQPVVRSADQHALYLRRINRCFREIRLSDTLRDPMHHKAPCIVYPSSNTHRSRFIGVIREGEKLVVILAVVKKSDGNYNDFRYRKRHDQI